MALIDKILDEVAAGLELDEFFTYQHETFDAMLDQSKEFLRWCLYYRTGAGKTVTALTMLRLSGHTKALVITPPITQERWREDGVKAGVEVEAVSHAKFRQSGFLVGRETAVVVDEFHLLGGHTGKGWRKMDRLAKGLRAPLLILSATPNYNDAERVYCIQHVMAPETCKGGYLQFLYDNCVTVQNMFSNTPEVERFKHFPNAEEYLKAQPYVSHVPDIHKIDPVDIHLRTPLPRELEEYGVHRRKKRIIASQMEERHAVAFDLLVGDDLLIRPHVMDELINLTGNATTPVLIFSNSSQIAEALHRTVVADDDRGRVFVVTGKNTQRDKERMVDQFRKGHIDVLIGTATLATGTDGLDKMCDTLIILNDTDDASLRRQLIGRIMPRGASADASRKQVYRLVMEAQ